MSWIGITFGWSIDGGHLRLAQEALAEAVVGAQLRGEHLQCHQHPEPGVLRAVDDAHAAAADHGVDQIVAELPADHEAIRHGREV